MKFKYRSVNYPTGYDSHMQCEKLRSRADGAYFVSINGVIHFHAVCDDFGSLIFV